MKMRAFYKSLKLMLKPEQIESINFETKVLGVYMEMDGKGFHKLRMSDFEIMWYTGLSDRNGKEIYEGDIVSFKDNWDGADTSLQEKVGRVGFSCASFLIERVTMNHYRWMDYECEVIGNIHDNPDLLEGEKI